jgi:hypothetical protein
MGLERLLKIIGQVDTPSESAVLMTFYDINKF